MDLHMIITISGIFVGMVILLYGIYSYDKLKKEEDLSKDKDDDSSVKEEVKEEKKEEVAEVKDEKVDVKNESEGEKVKDAEETTLDNKELSDFMDEEDFDDTLVLDKDKKEEEVTQSVAEIPDDNKITSDVEDLFD